MVHDTKCLLACSAPSAPLLAGGAAEDRTSCCWLVANDVRRGSGHAGGTVVRRSKGRAGVAIVDLYGVADGLVSKLLGQSHDYVHGRNETQVEGHPCLAIGW